MITIFSIPKPFKNHIAIIQKNAIQSWLHLGPKYEIILFGDDEGVSKVAAEFKIQHIPDVEKNDFGTPLLNSVFKKASQLAINPILTYVNADIILLSNIIKATQLVNKTFVPNKFLMSGRRWDLNFNNIIDFNRNDWQKNLMNIVIKSGKLHGFSGIDYFVFPRELSLKLPPFAVGRPGWDNWLIHHVSSQGIPVIDATEAITVIHQNHDIIWNLSGKEEQRNIELVGKFSHLCNLRDADWILKDILRKQPLYRRIIFKSYPIRKFLALKRKIYYYRDRFL